MVKHSKVPKIASLQCLYYVSKRELDEVRFFLVYKHKTVLQGHTIITPGHDQERILKVFKVTSLQYLYIFINISLYIFRS